MKQFKIDKTIRSEDSKKFIEITINAIKSCVKKQIRIIYYNMLSHYIQKNELTRSNNTQITQDKFFKTLRDKRKILKNKKKPRIIIDRKSKNKNSRIRKFLIFDKTNLNTQDKKSDNTENKEFKQDKPKKLKSSNKEEEIDLGKIEQTTISNNETNISQYDSKEYHPLIKTDKKNCGCIMYFYQQYIFHL